MRLCCIVVLIAASATPVLGQETRAGAPPPKLIISDRAIAMALADHPPAPAMQSRDSLKNGAIIGAVIGGVAMGAFGAALCHALKEPGDPSCWRGVLTIGALGAGIGAAGGAGIDALISRGFGPVPPPRTAR
jgi:hypothetical protein